MSKIIDFLYKLSKKKISSVLLSLITLAGGYYLFFPQEKLINNSINFGNENIIEKSLIAQNSPGATLVVNENKSIPYTRVFKLAKTNGYVKWSKYYNVLFLLPNNKKAFLREWDSEKEYNIGYANNDCSEIYISDAYKLPVDFHEDEVCGTKKLFCNSEDESSALQELYNKNPTALSLQSQTDKRLSAIGGILNDNEESKIFVDIYRIISIAPTKYAINNYKQCVQ